MIAHVKKKKFQQLKIHECLLSFTTSLFWNGWKTMVQKCENDRNFLLYHCWFQLISIVIHIQAILDFQNNLYFKETQQTNATIACHLWKKTSSSSKGLFSLWKASFYDIYLGKVNSFIIEQIRIIEFCPLNIIVLTTCILTTLCLPRAYMQRYSTPTHPPLHPPPLFHIVFKKEVSETA